MLEAPTRCDLSEHVTTGTCCTHLFRWSCCSSAAESTPSLARLVEAALAAVSRACLQRSWPRNTGRIGTLHRNVFMARSSGGLLFRGNEESETYRSQRH